ncbi:hypothetical protein [Lewinella sp. W8]|uniref:hypothetical protein n=1 Tax=Lewinella sp. W8 TaxID=2528208 RepID=UPI001067E17E|nr:hypothetical protein [Lewinella sp. W8]MTB50725.1 hypothetical protein [Lewinella sp. W8]
MRYRLYSLILCLTGLLGILACGPKPSPLEQRAAHYREHQDFASLDAVVRLLPDTASTTYLKSLLGEPIDMGFDYRYLVDSTGENNCAVGAVFHLDDEGGFDQQWTGEICE